MANIQAALNSMLASAQTGAFIATQTPAYKQYMETKSMKQTGARMNESQIEYEKQLEKLEKEKPTLPKDRDMTAEEAAAYSDWEKKYTALTKDYQALGGEASQLASQLYRQTADPRYIKTKVAAEDIKEGTAANLANLRKEKSAYDIASGEREAVAKSMAEEAAAYEEERMANKAINRDIAAGRVSVKERAEKKMADTQAEKANTRRNQKDGVEERMSLLQKKILLAGRDTEPVKYTRKEVK